MTGHQWGALLPVWLLIVPFVIGVLDWISTSATRGRAITADHGLTVAPTPNAVLR